jgi:hypothetical protein
MANVKTPAVFAIYHLPFHIEADFFSGLLVTCPNEREAKGCQG